MYDKIEMGFDEATLSRLERLAQQMEQAAKAFGQEGEKTLLRRAGQLGYDKPSPTGPGALVQAAQVTHSGALDIGDQSFGARVTRMFGAGEAAWAKGVAGTLNKLDIFGRAIEGVGHALSSMAKAMDNFSNPFTTGQQKVAGAVEGIPVVGSLMKGLREFGEAIQGLTATIKRQSFMASVAAIADPAEIEHQSSKAGLGIQVAGMAGTAAARRRQAAGGFAGAGVADPASVLDPLVMGRFSRQIGLAEQRQTHEAEKAGIEAEGLALKVERNRLLDQLDKHGELRSQATTDKESAFNQLGSLHPTFGGVGPAVGTANLLYDTVSGRAAPAQSQLHRAQEEEAHQSEMVGLTEQKLLEQATKERENQLALARNAKDLGQNAISVEREKLAVLREQSDLIKGSAQSVYQHTGAQRAMTMAWVRMANQKGIDALIPDQVQEIVRTQGPIAGRWAERMYSEKASRDPLFQRDMQEFKDPALQGADFNVVRAGEQQRDLEKTIFELTSKTEAKATAAFAGAFGGAIDRLVAAMEGVMDAKVKALADRLRMQQQGQAAAGS